MIVCPQPSCKARLCSGTSMSFAVMIELKHCVAWLKRSFSSAVMSSSPTLLTPIESPGLAVVRPDRKLLPDMSTSSKQATSSTVFPKGPMVSNRRLDGQLLVERTLGHGLDGDHSLGWDRSRRGFIPHRPLKSAGQVCVDQPQPLTIDGSHSRYYPLSRRQWRLGSIRQPELLHYLCCSRPDPHLRQRVTSPVHPEETTRPESRLDSGCPEQSY